MLKIKIYHCALHILNVFLYIYYKSHLLTELVSVYILLEFSSINKFSKFFSINNNKLITKNKLFLRVREEDLAFQIRVNKLCEQDSKRERVRERQLLTAIDKIFS